MAFSPHASQSRIHVEETPAGTRIMLRGKPSWPLAIFLSAWLCGWFVGELFALNALLSSGTPLAARAFLLVWLSFWTLAGFAAMRFVFMSIAGTDVILLGPDGARLGKRALGFEQLEPIELNTLLSARVIRGIGRSVWMIVPPDGTSRPVRIGAGLDAGEAEQAIALVREWAERQERLAGRAPARTAGGSTADASSASPAQRYLFYRPMELSTNRRGEDADAQGERSVGGGPEGRKGAVPG